MVKFFLFGILFFVGVASSLSAAEMVDERISAWLFCEECSEGELRKVVSLGAAAIPRLGQVLLGGLPRGKREEVRIRLDEAYDRLEEYASTQPGTVIPYSRSEYKQLFIGNMVASCRIRAAQALSGIGGAEARKLLRAALKLRLREDVRRNVQKSLQEME